MRLLAHEQTWMKANLSYAVSSAFLQGTEHSVDLVIYNRKLIGASVNDKGPRLPSFTETAGIFPSCLPQEKQVRPLID